MDETANAALQVGLGTHVEVELLDESGGSDRLEFDIVPDNQADFAHGFLGVGTPLAQAILGQVAGNTVPYRVGDMAETRILSVTSGVRTPSDDVEARRQAVIQQAVARSEQINDMAFALAVGSKWGDYDPVAPKE
jgi:Transcription elongation factor, GreA/GreB, C-term